MTHWICFWLVILLAKIVVAYFLPLASDESYYWVWSHHLQLSYFDHPPFVAWLFRLGHPFEDFGHWVRLPAVIMGHLTQLIWCLFLKKYFDNSKIKLWLELVLFSPLLGYGSLIVTPDIPLLFFWSLALFALVQLIETKKLQWYLLLGLALGLGFNSKYHMVLFVPIGLAWLISSKYIKKLRLSFLLLTFFVALVSSLPVFIWNYQNDFISFLFQLQHGLGASQWNWYWPTEYLFSQILLIFPIVIFLATRAQLPPSQQWLYFFAWSPIAFFGLTSLKGHVEANWPIIAYPSVMALAVAHRAPQKWVRTTSLFWMALFIAISSQTAFHLFPINNDRLKTHELYEYEPLVDLSKQYQPLFADSFQMASQLSYRTKLPIYKLFGVNRNDFYDFRTESRPTTDFFFFATERDANLPDYWIQQGYFVKNRITVNDKFVILLAERSRPGK